MAPNAPAHDLARYPWAPILRSAPSSGRVSALSSGLLAHDEITRPVQAAINLCGAQHYSSIVEYIDRFVKFLSVRRRIRWPVVVAGLSAPSVARQHGMEGLRTISRVESCSDLPVAQPPCRACESPEESRFVAINTQDQQCEVDGSIVRRIEVQCGTEAREYTHRSFQAHDHGVRKRDTATEGKGGRLPTEEDRLLSSGLIHGSIQSRNARHLTDDLPEIPGSQVRDHARRRNQRLYGDRYHRQCRPVSGRLTFRWSRVWSGARANAVAPRRHGPTHLREDNLREVALSGGSRVNSWCA